MALSEELRTCRRCGQAFRPVMSHQVYCSRACYNKNHNIDPDAPRLTEEQLQQLEELSDRNMQAFFRGVPVGELPHAVRRRLNRIGEKNDERR